MTDDQWIDDLEDDDEEIEDGGSDPLKKWLANQFNAFGTCIIPKGKLEGKGIVSWDYIPLCNRVSCVLGMSDRCTYKLRQDGRCSPVEKIVGTYRRDFYEKYQDLDQDDLNRVGFELMPLIVLHARMTIELSGGELIVDSANGGRKANPLLKEQKSLMENISRITGELDRKLDVRLKALEGGPKKGSDNPLRGRG